MCVINRFMNKTPSVLTTAIRPKKLKVKNAYIYAQIITATYTHKLTLCCEKFVQQVKTRKKYKKVVIGTNTDN